ncbi:hypothetical protein VdG1_01207 [Verticillium dahliae VDG1]|nr:hypothetical protein VdG1_01207 [Verticillium dahliae VDG1]
MAGKKRVRNFTADDRATHRIFEKKRREAFKSRLIPSAALTLNAFPSTSWSKRALLVISS